MFQYYNPEKQRFSDSFSGIEMKHWLEIGKLANCCKFLLRFKSFNYT